MGKKFLPRYFALNVTLNMRKRLICKWITMLKIVNMDKNYRECLLIYLSQELTGYSENNDQYFETAETTDSLKRFETHYNAK